MWLAMSASAPSIPRPRPTMSSVSRRVRLATLAGMTAVTGYVAAADPEQGGLYTRCPSRTLLGIDCPACGGLRGTHDLLNGQVGEALDHNLFLPALLGVMAVGFALWLLPLAGRQAPALKPSRWLLGGAVVALVAFTVARNLPVPALEFLASDPA